MKTRSQRRVEYRSRHNKGDKWCPGTNYQSAHQHRWEYATVADDDHGLVCHNDLCICKIVTCDTCDKKLLTEKAKGEPKFR